MKIGDILIDSYAALAPMAGVADAAFRSVCRRFGAGYTVSEMASARALVFQPDKTGELLLPESGERPFAVQIFGSEPEIMARGAQLALGISRAQVLDINMGCPTPKIVNNGDGSALMRDPARAAAVIAAVVRAVDVPVTVKFRLGWDAGSRNAVEFARMAEACGAADGDGVSCAAMGAADGDGAASDAKVRLSSAASVSASGTPVKVSV